jgi:hypothetical protein
MGRLVVFALLGLLTLGCATPRRIYTVLPENKSEPLKFLSPRTLVYLAMRSARVPVQVWVAPHPANRKLIIEHCAGSERRDLEGEFEAAVQPPWGPYIYVFPSGKCEITARVLDGSDKVLHMRTLTVTVCGADSDECSARETQETVALR